MIECMPDLILSANEKKIFNLLSFISKNRISYNLEITEYTSNVFKTKSYSLSHPWSDGHEQYNLTLDFNFKTISLYAYNESHYNGDHYNDFTKNIPWSDLDKILEALKVIAKHSILWHYKREQKKNFDLLINNKLDELINS